MKLNYYYPISSAPLTQLPLGQYGLYGGVLYQNQAGQIVPVQRSPFLFVGSDGILMEQVSKCEAKPVCHDGLLFDMAGKAWNLFKPQNGCDCQCISKLTETVCQCFDIGQGDGVLTGSVEGPNEDFYPFTNVDYYSGIPYLAGDDTTPNLIRNVNGVASSAYGMPTDTGIHYVVFDNVGTDLPILPNHTYTFRPSVAIHMPPNRLPRPYMVPTYELSFTTDSNAAILPELLVNNQAIYDNTRALWNLVPSTIPGRPSRDELMLFVDQPVAGHVRLGCVHFGDDTDGPEFNGRVVLEYLFSPVP